MLTVRAHSLEELFPCWNELSAAQQERLRQAAREQHFRKGEVLHRGDKTCFGLLLVKSGQLRAYILSEQGKEITLYRLFDWDICLFSASCSMKNIRFSIQVQAEKDTSAYVVPADLYQELARSVLPLADYNNQLMASRFSDVMWVMEQVLFSRFDTRLAAFLLEQTAIEDSMVLPLTHEEIARHMGSAREVVTRMLHYFSSEGILQLSRGKITITDMQKLEKLAR